MFYNSFRLVALIVHRVSLKIMERLGYLIHHFYNRKFKVHENHSRHTASELVFVVNAD